MNTDLRRARRVKADEFYTRLSDVEAELSHYRGRFAGKVVYCNCDNPAESSFCRYFSREFGALGLRGLRATHPDGLWLELRGGGESLAGLDGDGDFRSAECRALLEDSDVVVTNPPFSLFREYVAQLAEWGGEFLILGSLNAITYREFFPLLRSGAVRLGVNNGPKTFDTREGPADHGNVVWYTNLDCSRRRGPLDLVREYSPERYPAYDDYPAIEVGRVKDIPADYDGEMGVPITFLDKHCPEQFEIVGLDRPLMQARTGRVSRFRLGGAEQYARIVIRRRHMEGR